MPLFVLLILSGSSMVSGFKVYNKEPTSGNVKCHHTFKRQTFNVNLDFNVKENCSVIIRIEVCFSNMSHGDLPTKELHGNNLENAEHFSCIESHLSAKVEINNEIQCYLQCASMVVSRLWKMTDLAQHCSNQYDSWPTTCFVSVFTKEKDVGNSEIKGLVISR